LHPLESAALPRRTPKPVIRAGVELQASSYNFVAIVPYSITSSDNEHTRRVDGECFGGLRVDDEFELDCLHHRKLGRFLAFRPDRHPRSASWAAQTQATG
jgi:hypothetical protein